MRSRIFIVSSAFLLVMICLSSVATAKISKKDEDAIRAGAQAWADAANAGDWAKLVTLYTKDAVLMPPNMTPIMGHEGIKRHMASFPPISDMKLEVVEVNGDGEWAYVWGKYSMKMSPEGADPIQDRGKFLDIRRKQEDGSWLLFRDMYSSDIGGEK